MSKRTSFLLAGLCGLWLFSSVAFAAKSDAMNKAKEAASHSEWEQVVQFAGQATKEDAGNEEAWTLLGQGQMAMGDTASAVTSYLQALKDEPRTPIAVLDLTSYYLKHDSVSAAERVVAAAEERDAKGKFEEIKVARGLIAAKQGDMAKATQIITSAIEKDSKNSLYPQILARIYEDRKVHALAEQYYATAWKLSPGNAAVAFEYALVLLTEQKYSEALDLFKVVQQKDPKNKSVDYLIGRLRYAAGQYKDAADQFEFAVQKRPDHFLSWMLLGKSYFEQAKTDKSRDHYTKAEQALRKAVELRPTNADARKSLADVLFTLCRYDYQRGLADSSSKARAYYDSSLAYAKEALSIDSTMTGVYSQMSRDWGKIGDLDSIIAYSKLQLAQTPNDEGEFARLVNAYQRKKDNAGVVETLQPVFNKLDWTLKKAAGDTVTNAQDKFLTRYGEVYVFALFETSKATAARDALKQMLGYNPNWCDGYSLGAQTDMQRQNFGGAIPMLQQGVRACPKDDTMWLWLGDCYYFAKAPKKPTKADVDLAKSAYQHAADLGNKDAREKLSQLKQAGQ